MSNIPSISQELTEEKVKNCVFKNFNVLMPSYYDLLTNWLSSAYEVFKDIDKYVILIYLINNDFKFYIRNGIIIDYETFYSNKSLEIDKINLIEISKDLKIPKESVRRKISQLEKTGVIKRVSKKIFIDRSAYKKAQPISTLKNISKLMLEFSRLLKKDKLIEKDYNINDIEIMIEKSFSFCWYHWYQFLFLYLKRWKNYLGDLEILSIGLVIAINSVKNRDFTFKDLSSKEWQKNIMGSDPLGVNAMSISDITNIPRPTVVRKLKYLMKNGFVTINKKKLYSFNIKNKKNYKKSTEIQDQNINSLLYFLLRSFNQMNIS